MKNTPKYKIKRRELNKKGVVIMDKEKKGSFFEGRDKAYMDIDRIINEGMSGGTVHSRHDTTNIEEARDLVEEQPPYEC